MSICSGFLCSYMSIKQSFMLEKLERCESWALFMSAGPLCYDHEHNRCTEWTLHHL